MNDENELFLKQMKGVTQIKKNDRVQNTKIIKKTKLTKNNQKPNTNSAPERNTTTKIQNTNLSLERVSIKKNIKKNILKIDKKIDFHGKVFWRPRKFFHPQLLIVLISTKGAYCS